MTRDAPKYWDDKEQRVVEGVDIRKTSTKLADMLGTYIWVYSGDPEFGGDVEETLRSSYKDEADFLAKHAITLSVAEHDPSEPVKPKNVKGCITWGTGKITFDGMRRVREKWSSDVNVPWMKSYWEVLLTEEGFEDENENDAWLDLEGNAVGAAVVLDDNGSPFLVFDWSHPPGCHSSWSGYYMGKRLVEGKDWRLTDEERDRLGIGRLFRSVARSAKEGSPGVYEEDDGEVDSDEQDVSSDDPDGDSDEEDAGGKSEEVGEKRKASDGETGDNKRRRA